LSTIYHYRVEFPSAIGESSLSFFKQAIKDKKQKNKVIFLILGNKNNVIKFINAKVNIFF